MCMWLIGFHFAVVGGLPCCIEGLSRFSPACETWHGLGVGCEGSNPNVSVLMLKGFHHASTSSTSMHGLQSPIRGSEAPFARVAHVWLPPPSVACRPINLIFRFLQSKQVIQIWLYEHNDMKIEGRIIGFDEYMNLVLDDAYETSSKRKTRKGLGRILLKGDNISLMQTTGRS